MPATLKIQSLREVRKVTEWRDGAIWRTEHAGYAWVDSGSKWSDGDFQYCSLSTKDPKQKGTCMRTVKSDAPDIEWLT